MRWSWDGIPEAVAHLIKLGADVNARDGVGYTALFYAAEGTGNVDVLKSLLAAGADPNARADENYTPLMVALLRRKNPHPAEQIVKTLIEAGADVNARTEGGDTPLMIAARMGNVPVIDVLIAAGADPTAKSSLGQPISQFASRFGHADLARRFRALEQQSAGVHASGLSDTADVRRQK